MQGHDLIDDAGASPGAELRRSSARTHDGRRFVTLRIPARFASVRLARLVASGVASEHGLDVVAVERLRLLVDEACALLLENTVAPLGHRVGGELRRDALDVAFEWDDESIVVRVVRDGAITSDAPSPVAAAVLDSIAASWTLEPSQARVVAVLQVSDGP